jgi:hypothetical protein
MNQKCFVTVKQGGFVAPGSYDGEITFSWGGKLHVDLKLPVQNGCAVAKPQGPVIRPSGYGSGLHYVYRDTDDFYLWPDGQWKKWESTYPYFATRWLAEAALEKVATS